MNISGLSLITLVRTQESKFFIVNWLKKRMIKIISNTPLETKLYGQICSMYEHDH